MHEKIESDRRWPPNYMLERDEASQRRVSPAAEPARLAPPTSTFAGAYSPKNRAVGGRVQTLVRPRLLSL